MTTTAVQVTAVAQAASGPLWATALQTAIGALPGATLGCLGVWGAAAINKRRSPRATDAEVSSQIAGGFEKLVQGLQTENARHLASIERLRADGHALRERLTKVLAFAHIVFKHIAVLEAQIRSLGGEPSPRPDIPEPASLD